MARKKDSLRKLASSVTGISTPIFGVSWNPPEDKRDIVRRLVTFLEDRRVLYVERHMEYGPWVDQSILKMREEITDVLKTCPEDEHLTSPFRAMRAACRKFHDDTSSPEQRPHMFPHDALMWEALGRLRGVFGLHLARLCVAFGIDVEPELASIFPADEDDDDDEQ